MGFDSGKLQIDAIKSGVMAGAITQNPIGIGYETVKAAVENLDGKQVSKTIDTGFIGTIKRTLMIQRLRKFYINKI